MRLQEFKEAARRHLKHSAVCFIPILVGLVCLLAYMPFRERIELWLPANLSPSLKDVLVVLPMAVPVIIPLLLLIPLTKRTDRKFGIMCPACRKDIAAPLFVHIVVASRNCPHCGARVIDTEG